MISARWFTAVALLVVVSGCSSVDQTSTTLPWDERQLDGDLIEVRTVDCSGRDCPLGIISLTQVVEVHDGTPTGARGDTRLAITDETLILGCGPDDGREVISFDDLARSRTTEVIGEMPTSVWIGNGSTTVDGDAALERSRQVVSGSCG